MSGRARASSPISSAHPTSCRRNSSPRRGGPRTLDEPQARKDCHCRKARAACRSPRGRCQGHRPSTIRARRPAYHRGHGQADHCVRTLVAGRNSATARPSRFLAGRAPCMRWRPRRDVAAASPTEPGGLLRPLSDLLFRRPFLLLTLLLAPPLLWLGVVYLGSLFALLLQSFYSVDEFSGLIKYEFTLSTYARAVPPRQSRRHHAQPGHGGRGDWPPPSSPFRSPITRPAMRAAGGRRCSIWPSCCRCGRAISSRSMPGS